MKAPKSPPPARTLTSSASNSARPARHPRRTRQKRWSTPVTTVAQANCQLVVDSQALEPAAIYKMSWAPIRPRTGQRKEDPEGTGRSRHIDEGSFAVDWADRGAANPQDRGNPLRPVPRSRPPVACPQGLGKLRLTQEKIELCTINAVPPMKSIRTPPSSCYPFSNRWFSAGLLACTLLTLAMLAHASDPVGSVSGRRSSANKWFVGSGRWAWRRLAHHPHFSSRRDRQQSHRPSHVVLGGDRRPDRAPPISSGSQITRDR